MIFYVNKNKKIIVGRNNQTTNTLPDLDFHTIGNVSFSFIDDKNKIQDIDTQLNYYFAGKLNDILFISTEYSIDNNVITFTVDTYTESFLDEITKRNTEIEIEIGSNTDGVQKIFLRDYAFAQPRVYIEGLNPSKIDLGDYYTKAEIDSMFAEIDVDLSNYEGENVKIETNNDITLQSDYKFNLNANEIILKGIPRNGNQGTLRAYNFSNVNLTNVSNLLLPENTKINGQKIPKVEYVESTDIQLEDNTYFKCTTVLPGCHIQIAQGLKNTMCTFTTDNTFTYSVEIDSSYKINKPFEFERKFKLYNCC